MTQEDLALYISVAKAHPILTALLALFLVLTALGNVQISQETAVKWPRFASFWVVAQKGGLVVRNILKPILGILLPKVAREVVEQVWPGALTASTRTPTTPPGQDGGS